MYESIKHEIASTHPSRESSTFTNSGEPSGIFDAIFPAPLVSKPTPTPTIDISIRKANDLDISASRFSVDTNAQLLRAAPPLSQMKGVPIIHNPRPGGIHLNSNSLSAASSASLCARFSSHVIYDDTELVLRIENDPSITLITQSAHVSRLPVSSILRAYVR